MAEPQQFPNRFAGGRSISGVACQAIAWRRRPLDQYLTEARAAGFEGSELTTRQAAVWETGNETLRMQLDRAGLPLIALYHSARLCCAEGLKAEFQESVRAVELARALGARYFVLGSPPQHRVHSVAGLELLKLTLNKLGESCAGSDLTLTYQPHYGGLVQTPGEVDSLMKGTDPEFVSLCLDTAHIAWGGGDPAAVMTRWGRRVRYIQLKDLRTSAPNRGERLSWLIRYARIGSLRGYFYGLHPLQERLRGASSAMFTVPGTGCVDFPAFRRAVESAGYRGWLTVELDAPLLDPGRAMAEGLNFTRSLFAGSLT